jgi:hypothetical protein
MAQNKEEEDMKRDLLQLNAGTGMALGTVVAVIIALVVQMTTGDPSVWIWAIPVGVASGLAIGAGAARKAGRELDRQNKSG